VEGPVAPDFFDRLAAQVEQTIQLDLLLRLTDISLGPEPPRFLFPGKAAPKGAVIAVALDEAFSFYYEDALDLLRAWGAEIAPVSPLRDSSLPKECGALYLGGGYPELYAAQLASNLPFIDALRNAAASGLPIYAECGGLMYLGKEIVDPQGIRYPMVGLIPVRTTMEGARLHLGYRHVKALVAGPILGRGDEARGHEFHYSRSEALEQVTPLYQVLGRGHWQEGFQVGNVWASYIHLHFGYSPRMAPRFVSWAAAHSSPRTASSGVRPASCFDIP